MCVLAVRWAGQPMGVIANCVLAVPVAAVEGLSESVETLRANIYVEGTELSLHTSGPSESVWPST
eukprot:5012287-Amphidinium_carterae.1